MPTTHYGEPSPEDDCVFAVSLFLPLQHRGQLPGNNIMFNRIGYWSVAVLFCLLATQGAQAALVISNIEFGDFDPNNTSIATSLSFRIEGTIEYYDGIEQAEELNSLFIGQAGNTSWVNEDKIGTWTSDLTMTLPVAVQVSAAVFSNASIGDRAILALTGGISSTPDYQDGQFISGTFEIENGNFNPSLTDTSDWIASLGFIDFVFPDPKTTTGASAPEPTSFAVLLMMCALLGLRRGTLARAFQHQ